MSCAMHASTQAEFLLQDGLLSLIQKIIEQQYSPARQTSVQAKPLPSAGSEQWKRSSPPGRPSGAAHAGTSQDGGCAHCVPWSADPASAYRYARSTVGTTQFGLDAAEQRLLHTAINSSELSLASQGCLQCISTAFSGSARGATTMHLPRQCCADALTLDCIGASSLSRCEHATFCKRCCIQDCTKA